jgi:hypothetical protein
VLVNNCESDAISFGTGNAEKMRLDNSGNLVIGTSSALGKLHIHEGTRNGSYGINGSRDGLVIEDSQHAGLSICGGAGNSGTASIAFPNGSSNIDGLISYNLDGRTLEFHSGGSERMRLSSAGDLGIGTTNPAAGLDVRRGLNGNSQFLVDDSTTGGSGAGGAFLKFMGSNATAEQIAGIDGSMTNGTDGSESGILAFFTMNSGTSAEKFRIASNGDLTATDTSIASNSDQRIKDNISDFAYDLDKFKEFKTRTFDWKQPTLHGEKSGVRGFVAQELEAIDSYWVSEIEVASNSDDYQYLPDTTVTDDSNNQRVARFAKTSKLGQKDAMYVSVIQQLIAKIETLETKVAALEE